MASTPRTAAETFDEMDARIKAEMRREEIEEGIGDDESRRLADQEADEWLRQRQAARRLARLSPRCVQCDEPCDGQRVTETGEPVCSEACGRDWHASVEAGQ